MAPSSRRLTHRAGSCVLALAVLGVGGCGTAAEDPAQPARAVESSRSQVESVFESRYRVAADQLWVVETDATGAAALVGPDLVASAEAVSLVYALGDFTDSGAHPPPGYDVPTGRTAYLVIDEGGTILGGGVFTEDRSEEIERLGTPQPWVGTDLASP